MIEADAAATYQLPGDAVFPESVGLDSSIEGAYGGSLADWTLYRLADPAVDIWSAGGADSRGSVAGIKVDGRGRLWTAGGYDGTLRVYDLRGGSLLACFDAGSRPSCVNDIAFGPDGLNFNGIVLIPGGRRLFACQTSLGRFWRIELASGKVTEVRLDGGPLEHCDGLAICGSALYIAVNARNMVAVASLADDGSAGHVDTVLRSGAFAFRTAVAVSAGQLLVVNSQLDKMGGQPRLPFTIAAIAIPEVARS